MEATKLEEHGVVDVQTAGKLENKDHVYAAVHKDKKGRDSAASFHGRTPCARLEPANRPSSVGAVNRTSSVRSSSVEPVNHSQDALSGDEKKDYLYAVVDKANKKKRPPQVKI